MGLFRDLALPDELLLQCPVHVCESHEPHIHSSDASVPSHSSRVALVSVVALGLPPPPLPLPPRPHHFYGRISKVSGTLTGEYHIIQGAVASLMASLSRSCRGLAGHHVVTPGPTPSCPYLTSTSHMLL